jgi:Rieske 2Fe-2S family protein
MHQTLPRRFYADPDFYRRELERFYFSRWICAGRADQIPNAGDYFTRALADESIIVTRDASGDVHALFNVCRHRGTRLCDRAEGTFTDRIQCPYHSWTYDLTGRLLAAPEILKARSPVRNQDFPTDYTKVQAPSLLRIAGGYRCTMVPDRAIGLDCDC